MLIVTKNETTFIEKQLTKSDLKGKFIRRYYKIQIILSNENPFHENANQTLILEPLYFTQIL